MVDNVDGNQIIRDELVRRNNRLAKHLSSDVLILKSPIRFGLDDAIRQKIQKLRQKSLSNTDSLTVLIETTGGIIEVVETIYNVFREHYRIVKFIIPNFAYSAGTVLVLSGDEIYMDYYSVLGPIDPQLPNENGRYVSGLGYLAKIQELTKIINSAGDPAQARAELAHLLKKFDPAELFDLEQARNHSEDLLEEWLSTHKFKDWNETHTSGRAVSAKDKRERARDIAQILCDAERWHSHGRGIGIKVLTSEEIKLQISDFGKDPQLQLKIMSYWDLFVDHCKKIGHYEDDRTILHSRLGGAGLS